VLSNSSRTSTLPTVATWRCKHQAHGSIYSDMSQVPRKPREERAVLPQTRSVESGRRKVSQQHLATSGVESATREKISPPAASHITQHRARAQHRSSTSTQEHYAAIHCTASRSLDPHPLSTSLATQWIPSTPPSTTTSKHARTHYTTITRLRSDHQHGADRQYLFFGGFLWILGDAPCSAHAGNGWLIIDRNRD